ncbi:ATP-binding sensor histidine kinase [Nostoc sp. FACHB-110]|uniref:trifunctional serine/threonine-protein kinase/ATP-binding protein/sensor histidine kinase n=1 Tax=Nostoc sp. FACHB-110 TaxID=2692834 RepID=UPI001688DD31|nr:ATP-binding sensor histidine kinase [Nostoc sp. FACHB-110]MBD2440270.1 AAA family ATPase [Nostoc sp. FACHB-110]
MIDTLVKIPGYSISEQLYDGSRTLVYRAVREIDSTPVVIKLLKNAYPSFSELLLFRNQYTIGKNLTSPLIIQTHSLEALHNGYMLVMEDFGGISLKDYFAKNQNVTSREEFLVIAIALCDILDLLYHERIIHKDIKPSNILINPENKQVKLIDFSIASLLPRETQTLVNPNILEGTLAYISPEQTGRMNRGIDYRTDFYSLGVTFYELLVNELPFASHDAMELVHAHIAKTAPLLHEINPNIPSVISAIVSKLMAKNSEDRYQSALGLKFDLEKCLTELRETGEIQSFEIGQRDLCDRFIIPDKLYGRETEVTSLLQAFERVTHGTSEIMLVAGFSGIGKTAVVNEVHKPITHQHGYFIKGKFDQFNRNIPLSAFVQTLRDLMGQLLSESDAQLAQWRNQITQVVGENGQVLIDVIPELEKIIGKQPDAPEISGTAAQNRFNLLFQKFIAIFTTKEHPLVMFVDDLQWADLASLQLIKLLMEDKNYLLLLGAYRDNEVSAAHPLMLTVEELKKVGKTVNTITLEPLSLKDTNQLVADTLNCTTERALSITELINRKTKGNPFFTTQFFKALYEDGQITFNRQHGYWECDLAQVKGLSLTDDVVEFMAHQLQKLPQETQNILKLAACIGNSFDLNTLAIVCEQSTSQVADGLWKSLQEGLILPQSQVYKFYLSNGQEVNTRNIENLAYRFLHDRVQQAAYSLIPEDQKQVTHLAIGQLLHANTPVNQLESNIFEIVNHLNIGIDLITQPETKLELAQLNFMAGCRAKSAIAYNAAVNYFTQGINLLPADPWTTNYKLTLNLHQERLEAACLNTDFDKLAAWDDIILQSATSLLDTIKVYEVRVMAFRSQGKFAEVVETGLQVLKLLGVEFPKQPTQADIGAAAQYTRQLWIGDKPLSLADLPAMNDPYQLAAMQIMTKLVSSVYIVAPELLPLLIFKQVEMSIQFGNSAVAIFSYADYGLILCGFMEDIHAGYEFGQLSLQLLEKFQINAFKSRAYFVVNSFIRHWKEPLSQSIQFLLEGYQSGLETGDWESVGLNILTYSEYGYWSGRELSTLAEEMETYRQIISHVKQEPILKSYDCWLQTILNLLGRNENPYFLTGEVFRTAQVLPHLQATNDRGGLFRIALSQAILYYLFGKYEQAGEQAAIAEQYSNASSGSFMIVVLVFYHALIHLSQYETADHEQQSIIIERVNSHQEKIQNWANLAPFNHQHRWQLVAAEKLRVLGQNYEAMAHYDLAIASAKTHCYLQDEALSNELAAKFYLNWGKEKVAAGYMQQAYYCYAHWGAKAKVADLERRYPQLLAPILQQSRSPLSTNETIFPLETVTSTSSGTSSSSISDTLDLKAILKASQTISGEIELDKLLSSLLSIIIKIAGADKCILMLLRDNCLLIKGSITQGTNPVVFQNLRVEDSQDIPHKLIYKVKHNQQTVVLSDTSVDSTLANDRYIISQKPKSILCNPILHQGKLLGILYLENSLAKGAFKGERVELLNLICAQAAISLENAQLYERAQQYAQELEQALDNLQNAQLQIVQSEKMSALGNLVAGVAHEMNNPLGFIAASLQQAKPTFADIIEHLKLYQETFSNNRKEILEHESKIDLEYTIEDLPKILDSMILACDRLKNISTSLRTFSRADRDYKVPFNLHEGIDSTILILKHRLKANEQRPAIEVITNYGDLPPVECFPGQLNQVFMNILANAIDALDESNHGRTFAEIQAHPNSITITTSIADKYVKISIADNGKGMSEEIQQRIFDHLFTTKAVGKGTGLGLAIAKQIVEQTHGGKLKCHSVVGEGTEFVMKIPVF